MDKIKIIATLKWVYDLLREDGHYEALDDVEDCIVQLRMDKWVGLTDEEIGDVYVAWDNTDGASFADFARLIETKSRSKNNG